MTKIEVRFDIKENQDWGKRMEHFADQVLDMHTYMEQMAWEADIQISDKANGEIKLTFFDSNQALLFKLRYSDIITSDSETGHAY